MEALEIKKEFKKRKTRQIILAIPLIPVVFLLAFLDDAESDIITGISNIHLAIGAFIFICGAIVFSLFNWRCPACNKYLGKKMNHKFCMSCGTQLK